MSLKLNNFKLSLIDNKNEMMGLYLGGVKAKVVHKGASESNYKLKIKRLQLDN
jgi:hypothetical protein